MGDLLDNILGFMPQRFVFWTAIGTSLFILLAQRVTQKLTEVTSLPYMQEENQRQRIKIIEQTRKTQKPDL